MQALLKDMHSLIRIIWTERVAVALTFVQALAHYTNGTSAKGYSGFQLKAVIVACIW